MTTNNYLLPSLLTLSISAALCQTAHADDSSATDSSDSKTETISVVGTRIAYANNSTTEDTKAFTPSMSSVNDLLDMLPGVSVGEGGVFGSDDWSTTITMRGFTLNGSTHQLGMTVDGVPNGGSTYGGGSKANRFLSTEDTGRVEVMQGTSDVSSPSLDALGGTFNYISAAPNEQRGSKVSVTTGDDDARKYYLRYDTGRIFDGTTTSYLSLSHNNNNRWMQESANIQGADDLYASYKAVSELNWATVTSRISYDDVDESNYNSVSLAQFNEDPTWDRLTGNWTGNPELDQNYAAAWRTLRKNTLAYMRFDMSPSNNTRLVITPYYHHMTGRGDWLPPYLVETNGSGSVLTDTDGNALTAYCQDSSGNYITDESQCTSSDSYLSSYRHTHYRKDRYGSTVKLNWDLSAFNTLTTGLWAEYSDRREYRDWHQVIDPATSMEYDHNAYYRQYDYDYIQNTSNYYVQDKWILGPVTINAGVRQFFVNIKQKDNQQGGNEVASLTSDSDLLPMFGIVWSFAPSWEVYSGYSENYKALDDSLLSSDLDISSLKPETAKNIDLGLRYFGQNLTVTTALYHIKFDNRITEIDQNIASGIDYLGESDSEYVNVGGIESQGFEGSLSWDMTTNWNLYSSLTFNDSKYTANSLMDVNDAYVDLHNNEVGGSPRKMAVVSLNYKEGAYRGGIEAKYTGSYYGDYENQDTIPSHTISSLYGGYHIDLGSKDLKSLDLSLNITNLTDKAYLAGGNDGSYYIGAGRTVTATASLAF
ncbi:TonB-dependent receptor domain-containing protein [Gallaecimonas mangrovi]|uniref:TonB-dependent receptor domain-containing protein n=1 Tax=Gallaecimonas mangrovi TaxID=2291597 RepID=UPI000E201B7D|nr:TonB-dependent receptor [Gallaecimonas mangrovi]